MEETTNILSALSTLTPSQLSDLTHSILSQTHHHHHRLSSLLSSPTLFSLNLQYLHTLSLPHKTLLIARHLLSSLRHLTSHFMQSNNTPPPPLSRVIRHRDLDAVLLLLLLCEAQQHNPEALEVNSNSDWRMNLSKHWSNTILTISTSGIGGVCDLIPYIEMMIRCWRFLGAMDCERGKEGREVAASVAASVAAVVALPAVEVRIGGRECVICKEEMREGRDVCELPCQHLFHWMCILPWLRKRNTCPCCRFPLPSDDVFGEIQRLWEVLIKIGGKEL